MPISIVLGVYKQKSCFVDSNVVMSVKKLCVKLATLEGSLYTSS